MARKIPPLTDTQLRTIKPGTKNLYLFDGGGLYLLVTTSGSKLWRLKFRHEGKPCEISLGKYPGVSLARAREKRQAAKTQLADGINPSTARQAEAATGRERGANSFEAIAREWFIKFSPTLAPSHSKVTWGRLLKDLFPYLKNRPVAEITPPEILAVVRRIESRGALETAHRVLRLAGQIFRYAISTGRAERDPTQDLRGALPPYEKKHLAALTRDSDRPRLIELLRTLESYQGSATVKAALKLAPLVVVRPGELRQALWENFDLDNSEWRFLITKTKTQHIVPLSRQAVEILRELHQLTGEFRYVFPSPRTPATRPMSENAVLVALRSMGFTKDEMTGHGWRAVFRTIGDEELGFRVDLIEHQLAHVVNDSLGRAYNRTTHLAERKIMMQVWADYLDRLRTA